MTDPLTTLLDHMTPAERSQFDTVNRAINAGLLTPAERSNIAERAKQPDWVQFVDDLRRRLVANSRTNVRRLQ